MGCDIHFHIEIKVDGIWHHYARPNIIRNYLLFSLLAGVRNSTNLTPISEPKGIPSNITRVTEIDLEYWSNDGHNHSWLSSDEIVILEERWGLLAKEYNIPWVDSDLEMVILSTYFFGNSFAGFKKHPEDNPKEVEDVRFIFWFDN